MCGFFWNLSNSPYAKQGVGAMQDFEKSMKPKSAAILNEILRVFLVLLKFKRFTAPTPCFA